MESFWYSLLHNTVWRFANTDAEQYSMCCIRR